MNIKLSGIIKNSITDGVGVRYVIFTQGCSHNCKGCHNPETHDYNGGYSIDIDRILNDIETNNHIVRGITLSGGDPLYPNNRDAVTELCRKYKEAHPNKTIWLYTGYVMEQLDITEEIFKYIDVLVDGPFILEQKSLELKFRGSRNQRLIDIPQTIKNGMLTLYRE